MEILEQTEIVLEWPDTNKLCVHPYPTHKRSKGIHLSDILRKIAISTGQLRDEDRDDEMPLRVFLGICWEMGCVRLYPDVIWQPGEIKRSGIIGSPDGYGTYNDELTIEEWKFTAKSLRQKGADKDTCKDIGQEWLWMMQVKGYCWLHPDQPRLVRLHVCWVCGNYVYPLTEKYIRYLIRFTDNEVEGVGQMITKNKF